MTSRLKCGIAAAAVVGAVYLARSPSQEVSKFKPEPASLQSADMPAPSYSWASALSNFLGERSKKSEYSGL